MNIKDKTKEEVMIFIRETLSIDGERQRFNFSGYESTTGECTLFNINLLNRFAYLGIYDYTEYLFLDFYKGTPTLYLRFWGTSKDIDFELGGYTTTEIIYFIFTLTILSNRLTRRRS